MIFCGVTMGRNDLRWWLSCVQFLSVVFWTMLRSMWHKWGMKITLSYFFSRLATEFPYFYLGVKTSFLALPVQMVEVVSLWVLLGTVFIFISVQRPHLHRVLKPRQEFSKPGLTQVVFRWESGLFCFNVTISSTTVSFHGNHYSSAASFAATRLAFWISLIPSA